jgi:hypothetical protein
MKSSSKKALFVIVFVLLLVTLACGSSDTTSTDDSTLGSDVATEAPVEVTEAPAEVETGPWYLDEFDAGLDNWSELYFTQASGLMSIYPIPISTCSIITTRTMMSRLNWKLRTLDRTIPSTSTWSAVIQKMKAGMNSVWRPAAWFNYGAIPRRTGIF